eukprot:CAMPEP_0185036430 /NCGR_PEP_ID=MMETSP1103-20130426/29423_1 /TAXON_ID=36769 /ORGANISM="Paraphysomonas bandaiensis, Strain Caron Lab Isolate" /LENGTH=211 /DNA_ID=CAMNT_0027573965 /DNA_START=241 /DNA_END=873 /DNA_ORIENTATION=-
MVYNHHVNSSLHVHSTEIRSHRVAHEGVLDFYITAARNIDKGEEMFSSYGTSLWFEERGIPLVESPEYDTARNVRALPGCPSDMTEVFNGRVYARQRIWEGEVVEISRGLIMPAWHGEGTDIMKYAWYADSKADLGLMLLLGTGALYQPPSNSSHEPTLTYEWFTDHPNYSTVSCSETMLVMFRAARNIDVNEELTIPLISDANGKRRVRN